MFPTAGWSRLRVLHLGWLLVFGGCGGALPVATSPVVGTASNLAGNWLLYGVLPKAVGGPNNQPGFGISFDSIGNNALATAAISTTCSNSPATFGLRLGAVITGAVAADGSFTLSGLQPSSFTTLTITGKAPATAGAAWSGNYTLTSTSPFCPVNQAGPFTATAVQDLNGTYTGTGSVSGLSSHAAVTMSLTLRQGAPLVSPIMPIMTIMTTPINSRLGVAGSIQVQGFSCFSKGTISTVSPSEVEGGPVLMNFAMDDGSTMLVLGSIDDLAASQMDVNFLHVAGGSCSGLYSFGPNVLVAKH
jgi:hypothetical protein